MSQASELDAQNYPRASSDPWGFYSVINIHTPEPLKYLRLEHERLKRFKSRVPPGRSGKWSVAHVDVEWGSENLRFLRDGRATHPARYTYLRHHPKRNQAIVWMSDTIPELKDIVSNLRYFHGHVLVTGLGLGCAAQMLLAKPEVKTVTVIEKERDIIKLVEPVLMPNPRLRIIREDALKIRLFRDGIAEKFDYAWHDIWVAGNQDSSAYTEIRAHWLPYVKFGDRLSRQPCWGEIP